MPSLNPAYWELSVSKGFFHMLMIVYIYYMQKYYHL